MYFSELQCTTVYFGGLYMYFGGLYMYFGGLYMYFGGQQCTS